MWKSRETSLTGMWKQAGEAILLPTPRKPLIPQGISDHRTLTRQVGTTLMSCFPTAGRRLPFAASLLQPSQWGCHDSANEQPGHMGLPGSPDSAPFLYERASPLFSGLACFCCSLPVLDCNSLLFSKRKALLLVKYCLLLLRLTGISYQNWHKRKNIHNKFILIKNLPTRKIQAPNSFTGRFYQMCKKEITFYENRGWTCPNLFHEANNSDTNTWQMQENCIHLS